MTNAVTDYTSPFGIYAVSMSTAVLHQFQIRTHAATRCKGKRDRVWTIAAAHVDDALADADQAHLELLAGPTGYWFTGDVTHQLLTVDGGPRRDCEHYRLHDQFFQRADGGRDCHQCAGAGR